MPATSWTEASVAATTYFEGGRSPVSVDGYALFGMPIPIVDGIAFQDATASFTEASLSSATSYTETSMTATVWTEAT